MDRRSLLTSLAKPDTIKKNRSSRKAAIAVAGGTGLTLYSGIWGFNQAKHLLRRTMFGPDLAQIKQAVQDGLSGTIAKLFTPQPAPDPPVNPSFTADPSCPVGSTWINAILNPAIPNVDSYRRESMAAWAMGLIMNEGVSIKERMTLFWYNHFVTEALFDARMQYINNKLYRDNALGNFKELTKKVTVDPAMLKYLNGGENTKKAPNENYARELLELFTIGKGQLAGPGDYTNYTELDIQEMAKVLTGWKDITNELDPANKIYAYFQGADHNTQTKTLSNRFGNAQIANQGDKEDAYLIDLIFQQPEVARFISRKLYRWFVHYKIDDNVEQNIIQPMADMLIADNYEVEPVIKALLSSEHFFDPELAGCMIKNPIDYLCSNFKMTNIPMPAQTDLAKYYKFHQNIFNLSFILQQAYFYAPNVAGWKAYYQEPVFYQNWINTVTLTYRVRIMDAMNTVGLPIDGTLYKVNLLQTAASIDNPSDPESLIDGLINFYMPKDLSQAQKDYLKNILIPGLPDYVWTAAWYDYLSDPTNPAKYTPVENQLKSMFYIMCDLSEYQLC